MRAGKPVFEVEYEGSQRELLRPRARRLGINALRAKLDLSGRALPAGDRG